MRWSACEREDEKDSSCHVELVGRSDATGRLVEETRHEAGAVTASGGRARHEHDLTVADTAGKASEPDGRRNAVLRVWIGKTPKKCIESTLVKPAKLGLVGVAVERSTETDRDGIGRIRSGSRGKS